MKHHKNFCGMALCLMLSLGMIGLVAIGANAAEKPPLNKKVCVVYENVLHSVDGTLGVFLEPMLHGPNTGVKKYAWEKTGDLWILRTSGADPVSREKVSAVMAFAISRVDSDYICLTRFIFNDEEFNDYARLMYVAQVAAHVGLEFK